MKSTKIICTIGPASENIKALTQMVKAGMNVARLNFSHGSYENHLGLIENIRLVSQKLKTPIAILQDLQGPKIRIGALAQSVLVKKNQKIILGKDIPLDYDISQSIKPKQRILIEDGLIELLVEKVSVAKFGSKKIQSITCKVITGGEIKSHKGVNLPDTKITFPIFTKKDLADLRFGIDNQVDYIALSFVRSKADIVKIKNYIDKFLPKGQIRPQVIAKIERAEAVENFDGILEVADAIMVARGDLGVEIADSRVPLVQKELIHKCNAMAKPVIVATQMLDSMIRNPRPTRAEVSDVANAVIERADAVMLSGESATGAYPVQAVEEMTRIIEATEQSPYDDLVVDTFAGPIKEDQKAALIAGAVQRLAIGVDAKVIIGTTESGYTARFISRQRPASPIIILTDRQKVYRQMCLVWGVTPLYVESLSALKNVEGLLKHFVSQAKKMKLVKNGDKVVMVAGNPLGERMNLVQAVTVK